MQFAKVINLLTQVQVQIKRTRYRITNDYIQLLSEILFDNMIRFDGLKLMEMLRDKRLMFVGDSIQRGMFESMVCLVQSAIPSPGKTSLQRIPPRKVFKVEVLICPPKSFLV